VPINDLVRVEGTPLEGAPKLDWSEFVRTIACARITMPRSTCGSPRDAPKCPRPCRPLCFLAGANSIFYGDKLPHHRQSRSRARIVPC